LKPKHFRSWSRP